MSEASPPLGKTPLGCEFSRRISERAPFRTFASDFSSRAFRKSKKKFLKAATDNRRGVFEWCAESLRVTAVLKKCLWSEDEEELREFNFARMYISFFRVKLLNLKHKV